MHPSARDPDHWRDRARLSIAHGALTNSKRTAAFVEGVYPTHLVRGRGCRVLDHRGKEYVDFICANGTNLFGYGNSVLAGTVRSAYERGALLSLGSQTEVMAAERLQEMFPFCDRVRFLKTGTEACMAAIRIARAATGRTKVLSEGYHGWSDIFTSLTPPAYGVLDKFQIGRLASVENVDHDTAAVIVEPVILDHSLERKKWLNNLKRRCNEVGAVLIFDEVITGFRFPRYCVATHWGIRPDLIVLGKAIGGGLPLAAVGGNLSIMEADYFVSSTFAGDMVALSAFMLACDMIKTTYPIGELWSTGEQFLERFNEMFDAEQLRIDGYSTRGAFAGDPTYIAKFWSSAVKVGLLFGKSWFWSFPHTKEETLFELLEMAKWGIRHESIQRLPETPEAAKSRSL